MSKKDNENKPRGQFLDKILQKFKVSEDGREEVRLLTRHPLTWLKGEYLVFGKLAPWEKILFLIKGFTETASGGWDGRDRLYRYTYRVNPNHITVSKVIASVWDALNDPLIGQWMDRSPMKDNTYRWICRANHVLKVFLTFFYLLDLGFSPIQRMVIFTSCQMAADVLGTLSMVAYAKYFAGITPYSDERGKTHVWYAVGQQTGYPVGNIPMYIMGFVKDRNYWNDYRIYTRGYAIVMPLALVTGVINTFARNRVVFNARANQAALETQAELEANETAFAEEEPKLTMRESFAVLKHNKYLIYTMAGQILCQFTPNFDAYPIFRFLFPQRKIRGVPVRGEGYMQLSKQFSGLPITLLYPFLGMVTKKLGGPKRMHVIANAMMAVAHAARYLSGYKSAGALATIILADTIVETMVPFNTYADHILNYEMLDYVEYKTGVRSEGITMAFKAFTEKMVKDTLDSFTGNYFLSWTGISRVNMNEEGARAPERFVKWAWPVFTLGQMVDNIIMLIARASFPYDPRQKDVIEAELKERRALAARAKEEMAETAAE